MHFLYVIYSKSADKFYTGETSNLPKRLHEHNTHYFSSGFTKIANDWEIVLEKEFGTKEEAVFIEKFIKKMKSRKFILKIIEDPEILQDILK